jgi:hypothetical protein
MKKRKPQPSPVGGILGGHHEWAGWSWADAMRATERNAEAEKAGPENEAADTKNRFPTFERSELTIPQRRPLGDGRGLALGLGGGFGVSRPGCSFSGERRCWRERCVRAGALIATRRGQSRAGWGIREAISVTVKQRCVTQRHIVRSFIPAPKRLTSEECRCDQE